MAMVVVFVPLLAVLVTAVPASADTTYPSQTWGPGFGCSEVYRIPAGVRYLQVVAVGGAGQAGASYNGNNTGGAGGSGAKVTAIVPVFPLNPNMDGNDGTRYRLLSVLVGQNGGGEFAGHPSGGNGGGGGPSIVAYGAGQACADYNGPQEAGQGPTQVVAGGGGGGGAGNTFGSGGAGGSAGFSNDITKLDGQAGSSAYGRSTDCGNGGGGGGGTATAAGGGGAKGCTASAFAGNAGREKHGGNAVGSGTGASGGGGGGWRGGGSGGSGYSLGGGGGGAGSSYVNPTVGQGQQPAAPYTAPVRLVSIGTDTSRTPSVTITPLPTPTTTATLSGTTSGNNWFTTAPTVTLTAGAAGGAAVATTYYAIDNPACSPESATTLAACQVYSGPFRVDSGGLHTLTYFSVNALGLDEAVRATTFVLTPTTAAVTSASIVNDYYPIASVGNLSVRGTGTGIVGAAVYDADPAGGLVFNSSGAFFDVIAAGSGLTSLSIRNCNLYGGTDVYWWDGTVWARVSDQTYEGGGCVTITVTATTSPNLSQMTGTIIAAGSPPTTTAVATTADGEPYAAGTWTNQSVTVAFTCTANATATAPVTVATNGQNQSASGTCTDGLGQATETTFTGINVDKTPPTCAVRVTPTILWSPDGKPVAITGTVTAGDTLSGLARVAGGAVTSNEKLGRNDVRGFAINTPYPISLLPGAVVDFAGTLVATRAGDGSGRIYTQRVTVTDQAGNTNTAPCTWTVTVPRDQR